MTKSDRESGSVGIFNGESFIKSIKTTINTIMLQLDSNRVSIIDYGIDIDREGKMSFDASAFSSKFQADPAGLELFFSGAIATAAVAATDSTEAKEAKDEVFGLFSKLDMQMTNYTGYKLLLSSFEDQLKSTKVAVTDQYDKQKAALDSRYEILTKRFIAYDAIISQLNNSFSVLDSAIKAQYVDNN
jgi:flagellar hook-associated protein 2